ncbi:MAG: ABC transporter substrate binding protein [Gallionella sp.]
MLENPDLLRGNMPHAELIVAVGSKAGEVAVQQSVTPVLIVMTPQSGYETLLASFVAPQKPPNFSAIYINQPWDRQLDFLFAVLPLQHKVGVLYSPAMQKDVAILRDGVSARGGTLIAEAVESEATLFADLERVLQSSEVLLALPDSRIYSSNNVRNILLSTYRTNVPLIGFSQAYVNAGAIAAIFSTPEQLAEQAASAVQMLMQTGHLPAAQYPNSFSIAINQQVARSLGIELGSEQDIRARMRKRVRSSYD